MTINSQENSRLKHWGIPGMRWGVRRKRSTSSSSSETHPDYTKAKGLKRKKLSELSNDEIRFLAARIQLEKQYKELTMSRSAKARRVVGKILADAAKDAAKEGVKKALSSQQAVKIATKIIDEAGKGAKK